jgi:nucleotide-binding universal stress UspA family protein
MSAMAAPPRKIVVGLDGSGEAAAALAWARTNAAAHDRIVVVRAWDVLTLIEDSGPDAEPPVGFSEVAREALARSIGDVSDTRLEPRVVRGRPGPAIVHESGDADLIVVGHRGESRIALMLGSTANYVLHHAGCPVVVVRGRADAPIRRVVVGVDAHGIDEAPDANESVRAVRWVHGLDGLEQVCLLHGWFLPPVAIGMFAAPGFDIDALDAGAAAQIDLVATAAGPPPAGVEVTRRVVRAPAGVALTEASADADLVVVGSRGRGALRGLLLGSTSAEVAARAYSSVAVVR